MQADDSACERVGRDLLNDEQRDFVGSERNRIMRHAPVTLRIRLSAFYRKINFTNALRAAYASFLGVNRRATLFRDNIVAILRSSIDLKAN